MQVKKNTYQNNSEYGHCLRSVRSFEINKTDF